MNEEPDLAKWKPPTTAQLTRFAVQALQDNPNLSRDDLFTMIRAEFFGACPHCGRKPITFPTYRIHIAVQNAQESA